MPLLKPILLSGSLVILLRVSHLAPVASVCVQALFFCSANPTFSISLLLCDRNEKWILFILSAIVLIIRITFYLMNFL